AGSLAHCPDGARVHLWRKAASSFDHFVGAQHKLLTDGQTQRFGGREVDDEFEFGWLFDRYVARPGASQNLIHVVGRAPVNPPDRTKSRVLKIVGSRAPSASVRRRARLATMSWSMAT